MKQAIQYFQLFCYIAGLNQLTNEKSGSYYSTSEIWSETQRRKMGMYFLKKALQIFQAEGEKPILPDDIKVRQ
jgi:hypothetical protein